MQKHVDKLNAIFADDRFVQDSLRATITAAAPGRATCTMTICPEHCNAIGIPMGGVIFTLADFAFAVAANQDERNVVTSAAQINFLKPARGRILTAEAQMIRDEGRNSFYSVLVTDDLGTKVAFATATGHRTRPKP